MGIMIYRETNEATLQLLGKLPHLAILMLAGESVTDGSLQHVRDLSTLESWT